MQLTLLEKILIAHLRLARVPGRLVSTLKPSFFLTGIKLYNPKSSYLWYDSEAARPRIQRSSSILRFTTPAPVVIVNK